MQSPNVSNDYMSPALATTPRHRLPTQTATPQVREVEPDISIRQLYKKEQLAGTDFLKRSVRVCGGTLLRELPKAIATFLCFTVATPFTRCLEGALSSIPGAQSLLGGGFFAKHGLFRATEMTIGSQGGNVLYQACEHIYKDRKGILTDEEILDINQKALLLVGDRVEQLEEEIAELRRPVEHN